MQARRLLATLAHLSWRQVFGQCIHRIFPRITYFRPTPKVSWNIDDIVCTQFLSRSESNSDWIVTREIRVFCYCFKVSDLLKEGFDTLSTGLVNDTLSYLRYVGDFSATDKNSLDECLFYLNAFYSYLVENPDAKGNSTTFNSVERVFSLFRFISRNRACLDELAVSKLFTYIEYDFLKIYYDRETRLGGNHYLRCLLCLSLVIDLSGVTLPLSFCRRIQNRTVKELALQFNSDGMHYELSPGYHRLLLMDLIDYRCLCDSKHSSPTLDWIDSQLSSLLGALNFFNAGDDLVPQFNDNLPDDFPNIGEIIGFADRLGFKAEERGGLLYSSGYYQLRGRDCLMYVKGGAIGANNQLAHAHSDNLSFNLYCNGVWFCGNLPTLTYSDNQNRVFTRSENGSSAPFISRAMQADHWAVFRVGRISRGSKLLAREQNGNLHLIHDYISNLGALSVNRVFSCVDNTLIIHTWSAIEAHTFNLWFPSDVYVTDFLTDRATLVLGEVKARFECLDGAMDFGAVYRQSEFNGEKFYCLRVQSHSYTSQLKITILK